MNIALLRRRVMDKLVKQYKPKRKAIENWTRLGSGFSGSAVFVMAKGSGKTAIAKYLVTSLHALEKPLVIPGVDVREYKLEARPSETRKERYEQCQTDRSEPRNVDDVTPASVESETTGDSGTGDGDNGGGGDDSSGDGDGDDDDGEPPTIVSADSLEWWQVSLIGAIFITALVAIYLVVYCKPSWKFIPWLLTTFAGSFATIAYFNPRTWHRRASLLCLTTLAGSSLFSGAEVSIPVWWSAEMIHWTVPTPDWSINLALMVCAVVFGGMDWIDRRFPQNGEVP